MMKRLIAVLVVAGCAAGCWDTSSRARLGPDDSLAGTIVGPGRYRFEGSHRVDTCAPGRAEILTARDELHEWHERQLRQRAAAEGAHP